MPHRPQRAPCVERSHTHHAARARQGESSGENIAFWQKVEDFKKLDETDPTRWNMASEIMSEYINEDATSAVNISGKARSAVKKALDEKTLDQTTFDQAQKMIVSVMKRDGFPRYITTHNFSAFLSTIGAYNIHTCEEP